MLGCGRDDLRLLNPQLVAVLEKCSGVIGGIRFDVLTGFNRAGDDLVIDVRDVHHVLELPFA